MRSRRSVGDLFPENRGKLRETYFRTAMAEARQWLFKKMLKGNIATRDVFAFLEGQAVHRREIKTIDTATLRVAMKAKLADTEKCLKQLHKQAGDIKKEILGEVDNKRFKLRRITRYLKKEPNKMKENLLMKYEKKLRHLRETQKERNTGEQVSCKTHAPHPLRNYSNLKIFLQSELFPKKEESLGPFICDPTLKLNNNEKKILSKQPKFSVRQKVSDIDMLAELEKALSKHRINETMKEREKEKHMKGENTTAARQEDKQSLLKTDRIEQIWNENEDRFIYNPVKGSVNFNRARPTDYVLNKHTNLPKPLKIDQEIECEIKKREILKAFNEFKTERNKDQQRKRKKKNINTNKIKVKKKKENFEMSNMSNLTESEKRGLRSLLKRIKAGEICVTQTDKSGRLCVMTKKQYLAAGRLHTSNDREISWKQVKYLQNQVNNHTWWLSEILGYSLNKDKDRMQENLIDHGMEVPEMKLLIKDHKKWSPGSGESVPSRPVVNGRGGYNTHLSEIISQILEPIALKMNGAEVCSTEETLATFEKINNMIDNDPLWRSFDVLQNILGEKGKDVMDDDDGFFGVKAKLQTTLSCENDASPKLTTLTPAASNSEPPPTGLIYNEILESQIVSNPDIAAHDVELTHNHLMRNSNFSGRSKNGKRDLFEEEENDEDTDSSLVELLMSLEKENGQKRKKDEENHQYDTKRKKTSIRDYFHQSNTIATNKKDTVDLSDLYENLEKDCRARAEKAPSLTEKIRHLMSALGFWNRKEDKKKEREAGDIYNGEDTTVPPLQSMDSPPILIGGDVKTLYPSLDIITTSAMAAQAVRDTRLQFGGIDYNRLAIYLNLVLGRQLLYRLGLPHIVRERTTDSEAISLAAQMNKNLSGWKTGNNDFSDDDKREMVALLVQISTMLLMTTHIYSFGGKIYIQSKGAGIGLRASACLARIVMCLWDSNWAKIQSESGLKAIIFLRYVDDLRLYINLINKGWFWEDGKWTFNKERGEEDDRTSEKRTEEEIRKSFNDIIDCLEFTSETQNDFESNTLPTLDVQTRTLSDGKIDFQHFTKPMASNILLEAATALSKGTIFSALRQDLVRRLLNTRRETDWNTRIKIIDDYTQMLSNSGHKYPFAKSVILQAITKYETMCWRSKLKETDPRFLPLYRERDFDQPRRQMIKYITPYVWYTGENIKDPYRNMWKKKVKRSFNRNIKGRRGKVDQKTNRGRRERFTTAIFVPSTDDGLLHKIISRKEEDLGTHSNWTMKVLEKSGQPLVSLLLPKFKIEQGCPEKEKCQTCSEGDGILCSKKNLVYIANCKTCKQSMNESEFPQDANGMNNIQQYVGETARTLRQRSHEHRKKMTSWNINSFMIRHWMESHGLSPNPPHFEFNMVKRFKEPMGRQIHEALLILQSGTLNLKNEFGSNHICRLVAAKTDWEEDNDRQKTEKERKKIDSALKNFVNVMSLVNNKKNAPIDSNGNDTCRYKLTQKRLFYENSEEVKEERIKRRRMNQSTPRKDHRDGNNEMLNDSSLVSPIPGACVDSIESFTTISENDYSSNDITRGKKDAKTNLSDKFRLEWLGERLNRHNDTSTEYAIEFLCLENAALSRNLIRPITRQSLDWLNLEAVASRLMENVNLDTWSTFSTTNSKSTAGTGEERVILSCENEASQKLNELTSVNLKPDEVMKDSFGSTDGDGKVGTILNNENDASHKLNELAPTVMKLGDSIGSTVGNGKVGVILNNENGASHKLNELAPTDTKLEDGACLITSIGSTVGDGKVGAILNNENGASHKLNKLAPTDFKLGDGACLITYETQLNASSSCGNDNNIEASNKMTILTMSGAKISSPEDVFQMSGCSGIISNAPGMEEGAERITDTISQALRDTKLNTPRRDEQTTWITPKRKLSPCNKTPTGKLRKRSTTTQNSPLLRNMLEMDITDDTDLEAPGLVTGVRKLVVEKGQDHKTHLSKKDLENAGDDEQVPPGARVSLYSRLKKEGARQRVHSESMKQRKKSTVRRRLKSHGSHSDHIQSPARQMKITDAFKAGGMHSGQVDPDVINSHEGDELDCCDGKRK